MAVRNKNLQRLQLPEVRRTKREELGRGSYAVVFEVMVQGMLCAAKEVHPILMSAKSKENFYAECVRSSQLLHPNIVQFMGIYYSNPTAEVPWLVMELMYISLTGLIERREKERKDIPFHFKISILVDACQGLQFLHSKSIAHRDLSSNNILLTKHLVAKIADLGMAKVILAADQKHTLAPGTQVFMPPEALEVSLEVTYGITIDVFSLGCVCLHVISMQWPAPKAVKLLDSKTGKIVALTELQRRENYLMPFQQFPTLRTLVSQCLHDFPKERPTVGAVLEGLRTVHRDLVSHENNDIIQLCDSVANYKSLLDQKDKELAKKSEQLEYKEKKLSRKDKQLYLAQMEMTEQLKQLQTQWALTHEELVETKEQLTMKDQQLVENQYQLDKLQSQLAELVDDEEVEELEDDRQRRYDHLSLQFLEQCKQRSPNLMNIRKELPRPSDIRSDPGYYDNNIGGGSRRKAMSYPSKKRIELATKEPVELRKAEKRWVRPSELEAELSQTEKETQELFRKFLAILNKLTPQKFETLANQALEMPIDSEDRLKGCVDRIFIKALREPNFSVVYAQLCRVLSKISVKVGAGPDVKKKTFRSLLLTKCQQEFEKDKESDKAIAELKQKVEEAAPEEKKQLEKELSEKEYRSRHNYLGNIRFIGELFKIKMLSEGIMHECIRRLLQLTTDEEALECFAKLMFTIGKDLDHEKGQALIKQYMDRVELIINAGKISSRIKFILQDVVEIFADSLKKNIKDGSSKMGGDWSSGSDKDKKSLSSQPKRDSMKFRNIGKQPGAQLSLAPIKFGMRPGGGSPATMDKIRRQESKGKPSRSSGSGSKRSDSRSGDVTAGASGPMMSSGQSRPAPDKHRERQQALELVSNISGSSRSSGSSSSKGGENKPVSVLKRPAPDVLSEEEIEKKSSSLIAEFIDYEANWVPRRENNNPKKIDQIHQEAKQEEVEKMRELAAHPGIPMGGRQTSKGSLDMDSRKKNIKDGSSKMGGDWSSGSDKDKKSLSSQPKLDSMKFRNRKQPGAQLSLAPIKFGMRPGGGSPATMDKSGGSGNKRYFSRSVEVEKKSSSLIAEFCQNVDYEAAIEEVKDMKSPGKHHRLVCQIINDVLEKSSVARSNTGKLFHQLIRKNVISKEKFTEGFTEILEVAEDIEIDIPKIWFYLAEIVVPVIEDGTVSLDVLTKAPASIMESGKGAQLLAEVLKLSEKIMGSGQVTVLWTNSTVSYNTFKILNVEEFKKKYGLQFLPSSIVARGVDIKRLMELLRSRDNTNTEIINCIEKEYPESRERSLIFIRDLGMALFKTVIHGSDCNAKYNEELFDSRITIVTKYIEPQNDSNHQRQLEFLYSLQMVLYELEQPAGVATIICKKLSESRIFEDAAFHLWKRSGSETIGHGTTMLALNNFYDWLESTPVESDYSQ